ncbi:hypothetical protein FHL15_007938 [Xylaria flabelliformis]|uniref:Integral membrane protein n=1 Tax=Xylaria flabelliformis TaxID=2512241 RepID=A0A553HT67_9PEZI|nr:hypothetical protein FHL15_007938 [Xylaria flabelliformis]
MSANDSPDPTAAAAAAAAARAFNIQLFTLYSIGVLVTVLRTYARIKAVGIRNFHGDDILIWIAILFYTSQTVLGYSVGSVAHGLANNGMTDAERAALSPDDPEYQTSLILIPLPMLWGTSLKLIKKIASSVVLGAGIFVLVSATLKTVFVIVLAGEWGTREAFVAVFTTNLPMIFPLIKTWISPIFGNSLWSTQKSSSREGAQTIGGGSWSSKRNRAHSVNVLTTNLSATGSQEHMVQEIPLQNLKISGEPCTRPPASNAVYVTNQIDVVHEDVGSHNDDQKRQRIHESW